MGMRDEPVKKRKSKFLQSAVDGYVYVWTEALAEMPEMEPCDKIPDAFKKGQKFADEIKRGDIRFMIKAELSEEARVVYNHHFKIDDGIKKMRKKLRELRREAKQEDED